MNDKAQDFLQSIHRMFDSVVLSIEFSNYLRTATLLIDRAREPKTGDRITDLSKKVVRLRVEGLRDFRLTSRFGDWLWGPESSWPLNEIADAELFDDELGEGIELTWESDLRTLRLVGHTVEFSFIEPERAEAVLRAFWGDEDWR
jgi:hypothetical protein